MNNFLRFAAELRLVRVYDKKFETIEPLLTNMDKEIKESLQEVAVCLK